MNVLGAKNERSRKIYKNIIQLAFVKVGSVAVGLALVPLTIDYVDPLQYGIWLTISSVIGWMSFFDVGMANGLRNRLTHALAVGEVEQAKSYVSTTYAALTLIALGLFAIYLLIGPFIDWRTFLNIPAAVKDNIQSLILIVVATFFLQLVVQVINSVLTAYQDTAAAGFILFIGQLSVLVVIMVLKQIQPGTLTALTLTMALAPVIVFTIASIILYQTRLKEVAPTVKKAKVSHAKEIMGIGGIFFFIQIGALVLLYTNNIVISKVIGPEAVTEFNVAYKLYSVVSALYLMIVTPYWSAYTEAYAKADFAWMQENLRKLRRIWVVLCFLVTPAVYLFSQVIFKLWIGSSVEIGNDLSLAMGLYTIGHMTLMLNSYVLNGVGKLRIQLYLYLIVCVVNIPLSILLGRAFGTVGVTMSGILVFLVMGVLLWMQNTKITNQTARGIWNK